MIRKDCPNIVKLALGYAACQSILNRTCPEELIVAATLSALEADDVITADVAALEQWLSTLTSDQKDVLEDGEEEARSELIADSPTSELSGMCVAQLLDDVFDVLEGL